MDNQINATAVKKGMSRSQLAYLFTFIGAVVVVLLCLTIVTVQYFENEALNGVNASTFYYVCDDYTEYVTFNADGTYSSFKMKSIISAPTDVCEGEWEVKLALFKGAGANTDAGLYIYDAENDTVTLDGKVFTRFFG